MLGADTPRELKNRAARLVLRLLECLTCRYQPNGAVESRTTPVLASLGTHPPSDHDVGSSGSQPLLPRAARATARTVVALE
jgi:hypothetical protein